MINISKKASKTTIKLIIENIIKVFFIQFIVYGGLYFPVAYFYNYLYTNISDKNFYAVRLYLVYILLFFCGYLFYIVIGKIKKLTVSKWFLLVFGSINQHILYNLVKFNFRFFYMEDVAVTMTVSSNEAIQPKGYFNWLNPLHITGEISIYLFFVFVVFTLCYFVNSLVKKIHRINK